MKTRVLSGLIMLPLLIILVLGGYVLFAGCFVIGIMGVREFYNGFREMDIKPNYGIACVAAAALYIINLFCEKPEWYMLWFFGTVLVSLLYLFNIEHRKLEDAMATITGIFYVVFFSFHVTLVDQAGHLQQYGMAHRDHCLRHRHNGVLFRISSGETQALSEDKPQEDHRGFHRRHTGKCDTQRSVRIFLHA